MKKKIVITLGFVVLVFLLLICLYLLSVKHIEKVGTINYIDGKAQIVFGIDADAPFSLETEDEKILLYAKEHNGEKVTCNLKVTTSLFTTYFKLKNIKEIE